MNPLTNVKNIQKLNKAVLESATVPEKSWHNQYKDSAWIFIGGLNYDLTEGDIICVFSQYGEIENINLVRDFKTGKSKGFCFLCYQDQRSTILAVDNFNGIKLASRIIRVDHVEEYKVPKMRDDMDDDKKQLFIEGCAPKPRLQEPLPPPPSEPSPPPPPQAQPHIKQERVKVKKEKKKKSKKEKKKKSKKRKRSSSSSSSSSDSESSSEEDEPSTDRKKKTKKRKDKRRK